MSNSKKTSKIDECVIPQKFVSREAKLLEKIICGQKTIIQLLQQMVDVQKLEHIPFDTSFSSSQKINIPKEETLINKIKKIAGPETTMTDSKKKLVKGGL